jgi:hypothetical protein
MQVQQQNCGSQGNSRDKHDKYMRHHHKYVGTEEIPPVPPFKGIPSDLAFQACRYQEHPATFDWLADFCNRYEKRLDRISVLYRRVHRLYSGRLEELSNALDNKVKAMKGEMTKDEENVIVGVVNHAKNVEGGLEMMTNVIAQPQMALNDYWRIFAFNSIGNAWLHMKKMSEELNGLG